MNKSMLFSLAISMVLWTGNAYSVETIREADKGLVQELLTVTKDEPAVKITSDKTISEPKFESGEYNFLSKEERAKRRREGDAWLKPDEFHYAVEPNKLGVEAEIQVPTDAELKKIDDEANVENYRTLISDCLGSYQEQLDLEIEVLYNSNVYDDLSYVSQTFEKVNQCYEQVGLQMISDLYGDKPEIKEEFIAKIPEFYVVAEDVNIDVKHCGNNCSLKTLIEMQKDKFVEFRTYLGELLNNRPKGL